MRQSSLSLKKCFQLSKQTGPLLRGQIPGGHVMLMGEGLRVNNKRTERIYREEKLPLRIRRRKKLASQGRIEIAKAGRPNELWAMNFLHDVLHNGRKLRFLPIIDTYIK